MRGLLPGGLFSGPLRRDQAGRQPQHLSGVQAAAPVDLRVGPANVGLAHAQAPGQLLEVLAFPDPEGARWEWPGRDVEHLSGIDGMAPAQDRIGPLNGLFAQARAQRDAVERFAGLDLVGFRPRQAEQHPTEERPDRWPTQSGPDERRTLEPN